MLNKVILIGRLTRDPDLRYTPGDGIAVTRFTLAVDRTPVKDKKKEADFINITAWRKLAELCANYVVKGQLVAVTGKIQVRSYDDKDGQKRWVTEIIADEVKFLEWKKRDQDPDDEQFESSYSNSRDEDSEDDLPF